MFCFSKISSMPTKKLNFLPPFFGLSACTYKNAVSKTAQTIVQMLVLFAGQHVPLSWL